MKSKIITSFFFVTLLLTTCPSKASNGLILNDVKFDKNTGTILDYVASYIIIPNSLDGAPVIAIGDNAFANNNLMSVAIPNLMTVIGINAFSKHLIITRH